MLQCEIGVDAENFGSGSTNVTTVGPVTATTGNGIFALTTGGNPFTTAGFARMTERAGVEARMPFKVHPHMLRHACGFAQANKGHDTRALKGYLGYKNIQHTVRRSRPTVQQLFRFMLERLYLPIQLPQLYVIFISQTLGLLLGSTVVLTIQDKDIVKMTVWANEIGAKFGHGAVPLDQAGAQHSQSPIEAEGPAVMRAHCSFANGRHRWLSTSSAQAALTSLSARAL
jgi:hypothetical protein